MIVEAAHCLLGGGSGSAGGSEGIGARYGERAVVSLPSYAGELHCSEREGRGRTVEQNGAHKSTSLRCGGGVLDQLVESGGNRRRRCIKM